MSSISLSDLSTPKRMKPPPSSRLSSAWSPSVKNQEQGKSNDADTDAFNVSKKIAETMTSMRQVMENVSVYSSNIGLTTNDIVSPKYISKDSYENSPFGKQLIITDYSPYTSSLKFKSQSHFREDNPHISSVSFLENLSDSAGSDDNH
ncbi:hypothetical protein M9Y10_021894 [Tritrichomonas musculus]|uniref:Uncharacterized protein n=1 Tax=Tritrichomonas musculus TaxID=1915356 RepID=A0ABR2KRB2_9EUKA